MPAFITNPDQVMRALMTLTNDELGRIRAESLCSYTPENARTLTLLDHVSYNAAANAHGISINMNIKDTANARAYGLDILDRVIAQVARRLTRIGIPDPIADRAEVRTTGLLSVTLNAVSR